MADSANISPGTGWLRGPAVSGATDLHMQARPRGMDTVASWATRVPTPPPAVSDTRLLEHPASRCRAMSRRSEDRAVDLAANPTILATNKVRLFLFNCAFTTKVDLSIGLRLHIFRLKVDSRARDESYKINNDYIPPNFTFEITIRDLM